MAKSKYIETLEEQYTKKDAKSVLRYKAPDNKWRYVQTSKDASGMPSGGGMVEVKWQELKDKRDASKLTPGSLYRITDYQCTTTQENTRSAGHQFDIVLLALSENKLAEEGWAMMHENDTYFANSNLSAWKVWYCLDNDKSRFAWADDSVDISLIEVYIGGGADNVMCMRDSSIDVEESSIAYFGWSNTNAGMTYYTTTEEPSTTDKLYGVDKGSGIVEMQETIVSYHEGTGLPNGRGVIYRLIDEWNNDCPYDFKNIQFVRKLTNGQYDASTGTDTWVYTFNLWYNNACEDASVKIGNKQCATYNIITSLLSEDNDIFVLSNSVCLGFVNNRGKYCTSKNVRIHNSEECTLGYAADVSIDASASIHIESGGIYCIMCSYSSYDVEGIYILNKKVLTEK